MDARGMACAFFGDPERPFPVELWDGTFVSPEPPVVTAPRVVLRHPRVLDALALPVSEERVTEAFLNGDLDFLGDLPSLLETVARWKGPRASSGLVHAVVGGGLERLVRAVHQAVRTLRKGRSHSIARDASAVRHHYDVGNAFYQLFLDPLMVYSCALFTDPDVPLEEAQREKIERACRKLDLRPGERLLDVGCGWGAVVAHAAEAFGVQATGVTLSSEQLDEATDRIRRRGLSARVTIQRQDYRLLTPERPFDKVVSIGMMEHVGGNQLDVYFRTVHRLLRPGGLFLNHAIADLERGARTVPWLSRPHGGFIQQEIFPDSDLPPLPDVLRAAVRAGFEVRDVESLREHYVLTLTHWLANLERRWNDAVALVGKRRARAWRLYLAASAVSFRIGRISVFQTLLAKPSAEGRAVGVPLDRTHWARPTEQLGSACPAAVA